MNWSFELEKSIVLIFYLEIIILRVCLLYVKDSRC